MPETAASGINFGLPPSASGFRERWLYVDVGVPSPVLVHPMPPAIPNPGWGHEELTSPQLTFTWHRFERLRELGVTAPRVVKKLLQRCIAPLQCHSRPMWAYSGRQDRMRLQEGDLAPEMLRKVLKVLTGDPSPGSVRHGGALLYLCSNRVEFVRQMPRFDEWGLRPASLAGPRENPVAAVLPPLARADLASGVVAGRQALAGAGGPDVEVLMSRGAPEASSSGAYGAPLEVVADEGARPAAPEAEAPEASAGHQEVAPDRSSQTGALDVGCPDASAPMPRAGPHVASLGRFRIDFEALRKRKEASGGDDRPYRPLKHRKYFAMDE